MVRNVCLNARYTATRVEIASPIRVHVTRDAKTRVEIASPVRVHVTRVAKTRVEIASPVRVHFSSITEQATTAVLLYVESSSTS